jgi:hypothetical protein
VALLFQVLSTGLGRIVPNLISRKHTNSAATGMTHLIVSLSWSEVVGVVDLKCSMKETVQYDHSCSKSMYKNVIN